MTAVIPCHPRESGEKAGIQRFGSGYAGLGGRIGWWGAPCPVTGGSVCAHRPGKPGHHPLDRRPVLPRQGSLSLQVADERPQSGDLRFRGLAGGGFPRETGLRFLPRDFGLLPGGF